MPNPPAKRAAYLMIAIGVVLLVASFLSTMYALLRPEWLDSQLAANPELFPADTMPSRKALLWIIASIGALGLIESGLSIALGMLILRGRRWAIVTSLVLTILRLLIVGLFVALMTLSLMLEMSVQKSEAAAGAGLIGERATSGAIAMQCAGAAISIIVLVLLAVWLVQALRAPRIVIQRSDSNAGP